MTADDYESFVTSLCGPPDSESHDRVRDITARLLAMYAGLRTPPPPGLREFAEKIGLEVHEPR